jgi:hypothetical protein
MKRSPRISHDFGVTDFHGLSREYVMTVLIAPIVMSQLVNAVNLI